MKTSSRKLKIFAMNLRTSSTKQKILIGLGCTVEKAKRGLRSASPALGKPD